MEIEIPVPSRQFIFTQWHWQIQPNRSTFPWNPPRATTSVLTGENLADTWHLRWVFLPSAAGLVTSSDILRASAHHFLRFLTCDVKPLVGCSLPRRSCVPGRVQHARAWLRQTRPSRVTPCGHGSGVNNFGGDCWTRRPVASRFRTLERNRQQRD